MIFYDSGGIVVHAGDSLAVLPTLPDASVDAVVTDPPYNLSFMAKPWDAYEGREDAGFAYWLAGLIDGEGCFVIKEHSRGTHAPMFRLKLRADEAGIIRSIQRSMGVGTTTEHKPRDGSAPQISWDVQDKAGCQRLVDLLDKYPLRAKKRLDYLTWREAVCEWTSRPRGNRWQGRADNTRMALLRDRLMTTRAYADVPWSGHEFQDWCRLWAAECLRILKPGGHLLAFGGTRTSHRLACAIEDAGFEIRDSIAWLYGRGFPKSLNVGGALMGRAGLSVEDEWTAEALEWKGFGTALKPAHEPIIVARKPLAGTVAANVVAHRTGALNIDACRIGTSDKLGGGANKGATVDTRHEGWARPWMRDQSMRDATAARSRENTARSERMGRWPANVVLDEDAAAELDQQSGDQRDGVAVRRNGGGGASPEHVYSGGWGSGGEDAGYGGSGGASHEQSQQRRTHLLLPPIL